MPPNASRKQIIEMVLDNHRKLEPTYVPFMDKVREYHERTGDPRADRRRSRLGSMQGRPRPEHRRVLLVRTVSSAGRSILV